MAYESREKRERVAAERRRLQEALGHPDESLEKWGTRTFGRNVVARSFVNRKGETILWVERFVDPWDGPQCIASRRIATCKCYECKPPPPRQIARARAASLHEAKEQAHRSYAMNIIGMSPEEHERISTPVGPEDFGGSDYP